MTKAKLAQLAQAEADAKVLASLMGTVSLDTVADYLRRFRGVQRVKSTRLKLAIVAAGGKVSGSCAVFPEKAGLPAPGPAASRDCGPLSARPAIKAKALNRGAPAGDGAPARRQDGESLGATGRLSPGPQASSPNLASQARALIAANRDITNGEIASKLGIKPMDVINILHGKS